MKQPDNEILRLAIPSIVSNITVPLLGLVDLAIVGHLGSASYIAAISVGSMIFNMIYWLMGFLRMGTSGMTSQALGRADYGAVRKLLTRSVTIAMVIATLLLLFQLPLGWLALELIHPSAQVWPLARTYFDIVIWGAPAMLGLYSLNDHEDSDGCCYISECGECGGFAWLCLWFRHEDRGCCHGHIGGAVGWFALGRTTFKAKMEELANGE